MVAEREATKSGAKVMLHTLLIPIILTIITKNILYALAYEAFITFIYTKVKTDNIIITESIKIISQILFLMILFVTILILIAANADFLGA